VTGQVPTAVDLSQMGSRLLKKCALQLWSLGPTPHLLSGGQLPTADQAQIAWVADPASASVAAAWHVCCCSR
jgi:hypothetical protein